MVESRKALLIFCSSYQWRPRSPKQNTFLKAIIFRAYFGIFQVSRDMILFCSNIFYILVKWMQYFNIFIQFANHFSFYDYL